MGVLCNARRACAEQRSHDLCEYRGDSIWIISGRKLKYKLYIIIYDFGTSSVKTCLFKIDTEIHIVADSKATYGIYISENGGAEQDTEEWWEAICSTTRALFDHSGVKPDEIEGIAFCSQMAGTVLVDENGNAVRPPMNYLDQKGVKEYKESMGSGIIKVSGCSLYKLARNLIVNHAGPTSAEDAVWKYKWVENNEPEVFRKTYKWVDVGDYLVARCTGRIIKTVDSAFATFLYDTRKGKEGWNKGLLKLYKINPEHMPEIIDCTDLVGGLTEKAANDLDLVKGTPVFGGGGALSPVTCQMLADITGRRSKPWTIHRRPEPSGQRWLLRRVSEELMCWSWHVSL